MLVAADCLLSPPAYTQDMMRHVDLSSPMFSSAGMTRAEVEASLKAAAAGVDFSGKSLNGLDLSGLDFSNANFRAARMNKTNFSGANLDGAVLDQVWAMAADFSWDSSAKQYEEMYY